MLWTNSQPVRYSALHDEAPATIPTPTFLLDQLGEASTQPGECSIYRATVWTICSATVLHTTKQLMVNYGYHYPLAISMHWNVAILLVYLITCCLSTGPSDENEGKLANWGIGRRSLPKELWPNHTWLYMIPAAITAGASLPMLLEGILHMPSLPVLVMIYPVIYAVESLILFICCSPSRAQKSAPWEAFVSLGACTTVLYNEYRLMVPGLIWGCTGMISIGVSRAFFTIGAEVLVSSHHARLNSYHGFLIMSLTIGIVLSVISGWALEDIRMANSMSLSTFAIILVNTVAAVGTAFTGSGPLAYSPISFTDSLSGYSNIPVSSTDNLASAMSNLLVVLITTYTRPLVVVSWIQIASSIAAALSLAGWTQIHLNFTRAIDLTKLHFSTALNRPSSELRKTSRSFVLCALIVLIVLSSGCISSLYSFSINSIPHPLPASLDIKYTPSSRFDIVVSMYDESTESVKRMLDSVKQTTLLSNLTPNIIIYTKSPKANLEELKSLTGANTVEHLENLGREGGTYLHHIVNKWDTLAEQTMFLQAHAHNMRELLPRINSYLVSNTGMLSLGFTGVVCDCITCEDRWGWSDSFSVIPSIYYKIYGQACELDAHILLSYKGQFVASGRRIRGVDKKIWQDLLEAINSKGDGWSHSPKIVGDAIDTPDNPFFGFTMERIWGLLMQCATDGSIAAKCPSLLSGMSSGGDIEDCQCLDP